MTEEEERPLWASSPLTSIYDSEFPSDSQLGESSARASATSGSKRSREGSMDSDSVDASKLGKSQEPEASERPQKSIGKSAYKRANVARESTPATDSQYLHPETKGHGTGRSRAPSFPDAPSFEMGLGQDNLGGGTGRSSRRSGRQPSSQRSSRHTSSHGGSQQG